MTSGYVPNSGSTILTYIFIFTILTSSSTNSIYGFISKGYILDTSSSIVGIISTCFCSWVLCDSFFSWPSFEVLWFFYLYFLFLNYSTFEV
jgi:hypothetical protein